MKLKLPVLFLTLFLILALVPAAFAEDGEAEEVNDYCTNWGELQHPVGSGIALRYDVDYELVMTWFCQGNYGFGQIMLALETSKILPNSSYEGALLTPQELLEMKTTFGGWGQVWKELGFTGRPKSADWTGGPPEWAGPKDKHSEDDDDFGPPEWAGPKQKDKTTGPPSWARGPKVKVP